MTGTRAILLTILLGLAFAGSANAQVFPEEDEPVVTVRAEAAPAEAAPGSRVTIRIVVTIVDGWHIYGTKPVEGVIMYPTAPRFLPPEGWTAIGKPEIPEPKLHVDHTQGDKEVPWYTDEVVFAQDYRIPADAKPGAVQISVELDHMACDVGMCLDPATFGAETSVQVLDAPAVKPAPKEDEGLARFLWIAFIGGLGSILLPCVYPLIPLTVAFFSKQKEGARAATVFRAVLFCVGILLTFTVIGLALGGILQELAVSVWLNAFLFLLMVVLALSLFGMFDIQLPSSWTGKLQSAGSGSSFGAPIFMGIAFSFASFSCTVGVIGPILAGSSGGLVRSGAGMLAYALGFALPFFALALFPAAISSMPRGGGWMNTLKVMLGFFEVCFAGYYLWRLDLGLGWGIGTYPLILALWIVTTFVAGLYMLGKIRLPKDDPVEVVSVPRALGAIVFFSAALFLFGGFVNQVRFPGWLQGLLPPRIEAALVGGGGGTGNSAVAAAAKPDFADDEFHPSAYNGLWWTSDLEHGLAVGKATGRRVFLNFTGIYCTNCREVETGHMMDARIRAELGDMVLVELWTDITTPAAEKQFWELHHTTEAESRRYNELRKASRPEGFGTVANPWYAILAPDGERLAEMGYPQGGISEFADFLTAGKE